MAFLKVNKDKVRATRKGYFIQIEKYESEEATSPVLVDLVKVADLKDATILAEVNKIKGREASGMADKTLSKDFRTEIV